MTRDINQYYYVVYDNETVVYDGQYRKMIGCPTEQEATDYIRDNSKEE